MIRRRRTSRRAGPRSSWDGNDPRGYVRVYLGKGHPYANSGGWQWRHRLVAMEQLGRKLRPDEHAHHLNLRPGDDRLDNLEVNLAEYHGQLHAFLTTIAGGRGPDGRFRELPEPQSTRPAARFRAVIGPAATRCSACR